MSVFDDDAAHMRRRLLVQALVLVLTLEALPSTSFAQDPARCIDRLSDTQIEHRLRWIETRFERGKRRARAWYWGWLSFAVVAGAFSWTRFALADRDDGLTRDSQWLSGLGSVALVATMSGMSMTSAFAPQRLRRLPRDTPEQRRTALVEATRLLRLSARRQRPATRLISHIAPGIWASITGTYLLTRYREENTDLIVPVGIAYAFPLIVAEARIQTQPTRAMRHYEQYRAFACSDAYVPTPEEERDPLAEDEEDTLEEAPPEPDSMEEAPAETTPEGARGLGEGVQFGLGAGYLQLRMQF
jgi:hypothetical protein